MAGVLYTIWSDAVRVWFCYEVGSAVILSALCVHIRLHTRVCLGWEEKRRGEEVILCNRHEWFRHFHQSPLGCLPSAGPFRAFHTSCPRDPDHNHGVVGQGLCSQEGTTEGEAVPAPLPPPPWSLGLQWQGYPPYGWDEASPF